MQRVIITLDRSIATPTVASKQRERKTVNTVVRTLTGAIMCTQTGEKPSNRQIDEKCALSG